MEEGGNFQTSEGKDYISHRIINQKKRGKQIGYLFYIVYFISQKLITIILHYINVVILMKPYLG